MQAAFVGDDKNEDWLIPRNPAPGQGEDGMLVTIQGSEPVTTTLAIASGLGGEHASVIKLVRTYADDLKDFGHVDLESTRCEGGSRPVEFAILNEQRATLLISYSRNTDVVREFKKRLVKAFYEARDARAASRQADSRASVLSRWASSRGCALAVAARWPWGASMSSWTQGKGHRHSPAFEPLPAGSPRLPLMGTPMGTITAIRHKAVPVIPIVPRVRTVSDSCWTGSGRSGLRW